MLRNKTQPCRAAGFIGEDDIEENGGEAHRVESDIKINIDDIGHQHGRGLADLLPELRRVREDGRNNHFGTIIARFGPSNVAMP